MRIIVVGAGEVGTYIADRLSRQEHDIALIELDPERYRQIDAELDVLAINGSGTDSGVLKKAGIADTDLLVAATNKDEINLFSAYLHVRQEWVKRSYELNRESFGVKKSVRYLKNSMTIW